VLVSTAVFHSAKNQEIRNITVIFEHPVKCKIKDFVLLHMAKDLTGLRD